MTACVSINLSFVKLLIPAAAMHDVELVERESQVVKVLHPQENFSFKIMTKTVEPAGSGNGSVGKVLAVHLVLS